MATTPTGRDVHAADEWERRLTAERSSLRRVAAAVVTGSDPAAALSLAAEEVASLMGVEQGFVFRFEADRVIVAGVHGIERSPVGAVHEMLEDGVLPRVFRTRAPARVEGCTRPLGRQNSDQYWIAPQYSGGIGAPVFVGDRLWGALVAATTRPDPFPSGAEGRLAYFAEVAGIAIGNAEANARLAALAMTDPLTGLANHRAFHQALADEVERAGRHSRPLALAVIDVDHFKSVNDAHGHMAGDRVLVEVARRLVGACRRGDLVARVGGEEFAWLIPEADAAGALRVGERARQAVAREHFAGVGAVTVSIGVAELAHGDVATALYNKADGALYEAKDAGRNRIRAHGEGAPGRAGPDSRTAVVIRSLGHAMSAHDPALGQRCERVAALAERMALAAGWPAGDARRLHDAALVKDVGLLGAATPAARDDGGAAWPAHVPLGAGLAEGVLGADQTAWVRGHHERWDGGGFPDGLRGEEIPEGARLIAVADAWDALGAAGDDGARCGHAAAWQRMAQESGRRYCPRAVAALEAVLRQDREGGP